jgi:acyl-CoA dehydrogenase
MEFELPPDAIMLRDMLRKFIQKEARPLEMKYFTSGALEPKERARLRQAIEQMGLWGLTVPEAYGGGLDTVSACLIEEELGKTFIPLDIGEVAAPLYACQNGQAARYLEPALAGERRCVLAVREPGPEGYKPQQWATSAESNGQGYNLSGRKSLAVLPGAEDFIVLYAASPGGISAFLLDADYPGLSFGGHGEVILDIADCQVGEDALLGEPGKALGLGAEEAPRAWIRTGARYLGIVERLIEMSSEHARDWVSLGAALAVRPAVQRMLAEMRVDVESARWLVYHAAWLADTGSAEALRGPAAQVRLATGEMLQRCVDRATMLFAGPGSSDQIEPNRLVHSLVPPQALELALEQARTAIAIEMLGLEPG